MNDFINFLQFQFTHNKHFWKRFCWNLYLFFSI